MKIKHRLRFVEGDMDTEKHELISVGNRKYGDVSLCVKSNMNIPIAKVRLHSEDLAVEADAVFEDAEKLGDEIARRWNQSAVLEKENFEQSDLIARLQATLDGDPSMTATPEQRRAWRASAVRYADKLEALLKDALIALQCNPEKFPRTIKAIEEVLK